MSRIRAASALPLSLHQYFFLGRGKAGGVRGCERSMWEAVGKLSEFSALSIGVARGREGRWLFPCFWLPSLPLILTDFYLLTII